MPNSSRVLRDRLDSETRVETGGLLLADAVRVPGLTILHHPERDRAGERAALTGWMAGRTERLGRSEPAFAPPGHGGERPLADSHLSRRPIEIRPGKAGVKSKVAIVVTAGGRAYGEVIAKFPKLSVSYLRPGGVIDPPTRFAPETLDLEAARTALEAEAKGGEIVFEQVSYKEIAQAGSAGFGGFQDGN